jgi:DNA repair protein SbcC/Rad50
MAHPIMLVSTSRVARLQTTSKARAEAVSSLASARREEDAMIRRQLTPNDRARLLARRQTLEAAAEGLGGMMAGARNGVHLAAEATAKARTLAEFQIRHGRAVALRQSITDLVQEWEIMIPLDDESPHKTLDHLEQHAIEEMASIDERQQIRRAALADVRSLRDTATALQEQRKALRRNAARMKTVNEALATANSRRETTRHLATIANEARAAVVRRVFSDALNRIWRDLFIRLAPDEPFIPTFLVPDPSSGPIVAVLKTMHRSGGQGGSPGAMLSAGNLNTAALTLFLALHLSVEPRLPWLVLDDPVQSMDEVHVSQFAALLRTLAKTHSRQILIAVHERALFEYLALELSPSYDGDRVITVELARSADGDTLAEPKQRVWEPDRAVVAA